MPQPRSRRSYSYDGLNSALPERWRARDGYQSPGQALKNVPRPRSDTREDSQRDPAGESMLMHFSTNSSREIKNDKTQHASREQMSNGENTYGSGDNLERPSSTPYQILDPAQPHFIDDSPPANLNQLSSEPIVDPDALSPTSHSSLRDILRDGSDGHQNDHLEQEAPEQQQTDGGLENEFLSPPANVGPDAFSSFPDRENSAIPDHFLNINSVLSEQGNRALMLSDSKVMPDSGEGEEDVKNFAQQVLRCRRRIDVILLKRTEWRQENQKLEYCRRHLLQSTNNLMAAILEEREANLQPGSPKWKRKRKKKQDGQGEEGLTAGQSSSKTVPSDAKVDSGFNLLERDAKGDVESENTTASPPNIAGLHELYLEDVASLKHQEEIVKKLMEDLSNKEFQLDKLYKDIKRNMHSRRFADELRAEMLDQSLLSLPATSEAHSDDEIPTPVEDYFEVAGEIGICKERLQELDYAHQEGRTERNFLRDQGEELVVSDEEFESNYLAQRNQVEEDLKHAEEQLALLLEHCKELGLDPKDYRYAARSTGSASPLQSVQAGRTSLLPFEQASEPEPSRPLSPSALGQPQKQIERWLRAVPVVDTEGPPEIHPFDISRRSSEESLDDEQAPFFSLASFEFHSFNTEAFGLPKIPERVEDGDFVPDSDTPG